MECAIGLRAARGEGGKSAGRAGGMCGRVRFWGGRGMRRGPGRRMVLELAWAHDGWRSLRGCQWV